MRPGLYVGTFGIAFLLCSAPVFADKASLPAPQGYVTDTAGALKQKTRNRLEQELKSFQRQTGDEIAVAIISTLDGDTIEDYSVKLFQKWGVGNKNTNSGVLLVLALQDHRVHIEVGYGLEDRLPDAVCGDIIRESLVPALKQGAISDGLFTAVRDIESRLSSSESPSAVSRHRIPSRIPWSSLTILFFVGLFNLPFTTIGVLLGALALWRLNIGFWVALFPLIGLIVDMTRPRSARPGSYWGGYSNWGSGGFGGGGFSGGGGFGGFGGGSSGGGGASGSW